MQTQLHCPNCNAEIKSEDINIAQLVAKCSNCHTVFSFERGIRSRPEVLLPDGIETLRLLSELDIRIKWNSSIKGFLVFFTAFWNAIVLPMGFFAIISGEYEMLLFMGLHLTVGVSMLYYTLALFLNTTHVSVSRRQIKIEHRPLKMPFYRGKEISAIDLTQIFTEKYVASTSNNKPNYAFKVVAIMQNEKRVDLVKGLLYPQQGQYLEQQIEEFLNIDDVAVGEEYKNFNTGN